MGDIQSVFPGNPMPVQPGPSGDEEDGVGVFFISRQLMFTALLSVPVITRLPLLGRMRTSACGRRNSEPHSYDEKKKKCSGHIYQTWLPQRWKWVSVFTVSIAINERKGTLWLAGKTLHKSRKCGPMRLCFQLNSFTVLVVCVCGGKKQMNRSSRKY